ncbi:MAG: DUF3987 domain-containing protein, partial [Clostridiales bacterium]|nr:DUF3987 domain-containing protein [Clostridiales bacterium]
SPPPAPAGIKAQYDRLLLDLLEKSTGPEITLMMSPEADKMREDYQKAVETRMMPGGRWCDMTDWAGKIVGTTCRIAALLKLADDACNHYGDPWAEKKVDPSATRGNEVNADEMARAIKIAVCLGSHAERAYGLGADGGEDLARKAAAKLEAAGKDKTTRRELQRKLKVKADEMGDVLDILEERGYVRVKQVPRKGGGYGRPKETIEVNPEIWKTI